MDPCPVLQRERPSNRRNDDGIEDVQPFLQLSTLTPFHLYPKINLQETMIMVV